MEKKESKKVCELKCVIEYKKGYSEKYLSDYEYAKVSVVIDNILIVLSPPDNTSKKLLLNYVKNNGKEE